MTLRRCLLAAVVLAISACNRDMSTGVVPRSIAADAGCPAASRFAPYGVSIPAESPACPLYDRIFDPHGPPLRNTMPDKNIAVTHAKRVPYHPNGERRNRKSGRLPQPGTGDAGWLVNSDYETWGPGNVEVVNRTLQIPANIADAAPPDTGAIIFAPTNKPRGSCLELTVIYLRYPGDASTTRELGWYDFCVSPPRWQTVEDMNSPLWASNYISSGYWLPENQNEDVIYWGVRSVAGTNCWTGLLFNFSQLTYEKLKR